MEHTKHRSFTFIEKQYISGTTGCILEIRSKRDKHKPNAQGGPL